MLGYPSSLELNANSLANQLTQLLTSYNLLFQGVFVFKGKKRKAIAGMLGWNKSCLYWLRNCYQFFGNSRVLNSLWSCDTSIGIGSTSVQVMACCLMATSHCLNQYWLIIISEVLWQISQEMLKVSILDMSLKMITGNFRLQLHLRGGNNLI